MKAFYFLEAFGMYILGSLLFFVFSSKNILIYNEELLILVSFLAFVATSAHTMGDSIAETFRVRREAIQDELQAFFSTKETMLYEVKHQTIMQTALAECMHALGSLVEKELHTLHAHRDMTVKNTVQTYTTSQLQRMAEGSQAALARIHMAAATGFKYRMMHAYHTKKETMHAQFMENALHLLQSMHEKTSSQASLKKQKPQVVKPSTTPSAPSAPSAPSVPSKPRQPMEKKKASSKSTPPVDKKASSKPRQPLGKKEGASSKPTSGKKNRKDAVKKSKDFEAFDALDDKSLAEKLTELQDLKFFDIADVIAEKTARKKA